MVWFEHSFNNQRLLLGGSLALDLGRVIALADQTRLHDVMKPPPVRIDDPDMADYDVILFGEIDAATTLQKISSINQACERDVPVVGVVASAGSDIKLRHYAAGARYVISLDYPLSAILACFRYISKLCNMAEIPPFEGYYLDFNRLILRDTQGVEADLTLREASLLATLGKRFPEAARHRELLDAMNLKWGVYDERAMQTFVSRLRRKLRQRFVANLVLSSRGYGYRATEPIIVM